MNSRQIRRSRLRDAETFPSIERSAGLTFRDVSDLAWIAEDDDLPVEFHLPLILAGTSWTAVNPRDRPIGFLSAEIIFGDLHFWELSVRHDQQRSGIGRRLLEYAIAEAKARNLTLITLTTFRDVPWNAPFYRKLGFQILSRPQLSPRLADLMLSEAARGLPPERRCAMRLFTQAD